MHIGKPQKNVFLMAVGGGVKGLPLRKKLLFGDFFLFINKVPTAIKLEEGHCH